MAVPKSGLLVDDESHIRLYMRMVLQSLGVENVYEANGGDAALAIFSAQNPDFVLMDINMPGMTGIEILQEMTARNPDIPVIMLTGQASREAVESCRDAGAVYFIRKDTPKAELTEILRSVFTELTEDESDA